MRILYFRLYHMKQGKNLVDRKLEMVFFYTRYIHVNLDAEIARCPQGLFIPSSSLLGSVIFCL